jgi:hypothetical protein
VWWYISWISNWYKDALRIINVSSHSMVNYVQKWILFRPFVFSCWKILLDFFYKLPRAIVIFTSYLAPLLFLQVTSRHCYFYKLPRAIVIFTSYLAPLLFLIWIIVLLVNLFCLVSEILLSLSWNCCSVSSLYIISILIKPYPLASGRFKPS